MTVASAPGKIHVLPEPVVSRIAAGEVVERPAAVVKELIDNSLDAGARVITVEIAEAGLRLIRIRDDGEGMTAADAARAFLRHATSKLRDDADLSRIATMGFRGEALPSIAAVSQVRLTTLSRGEPVGTRLSLRGGTVEKTEETSAPPGTDVEVAELFFNTPARRKFLKSPATEFSHICLAVQQAALAHPFLHVRLIHNGLKIFEYPAVGGLRERILQVYGATLASQLVEIRGERPGMQLLGYAVEAVHARTVRTPQELYVNRRPVKNAAVLHAVYDGYGPALAKGRHPVFVLTLAVEPARVDVNVHPTKREVRFADHEQIHQLVRQAVRRAVGQHAAMAPGMAMLPSGVEPVRDAGLPFHQPDATRPSGNGGGHSTAAEPPPAPYARAASADPVAVVALGQLFDTLMVAQVGAELTVIDQHTAHERVLYERLWRAWKAARVETQPLLIAQPIDVAPSQAVVLREHLTDMAALGLELEPFGAHAFLLRAVPALLGSMDAAGLVQDVADDLADWNAAGSLDARVRPIFATMACHAAVRAGRTMQPVEIAALIREWVGEEMPTTCPHGRRIALRLPADELMKMFGRA